MKYVILSLLCSISLISASAQKNKKGREYYQLTVYRFSSPQQEQTIDKYLSQALLPALHRQKINKVGVFKPIANDTASTKTIYVLVPLANLQEADILETRLRNDATLQQDGQEYINAAYNAAPYQRMETWLLKAFPLAPQMNLPQLSSPKEEHVYEFRSYESATEALYRNKVKMFNEGGEIALFKRLQFNAIFYAETIAGSRMPNLVYMTSFENMEERNKHWKSFSDDPEWKKLVAMPEYKNNVSRNETILMRAATYSDY